MLKNLHYKTKFQQKLGCLPINKHHPESLDEYPLTKLKFEEDNSETFWLEIPTSDFVLFDTNTHSSFVCPGTLSSLTKDLSNLQSSKDAVAVSESLLQGIFEDKEGSVNDVDDVDDVADDPEEVDEEKDSAERLLFPGP